MKDTCRTCKSTFNPTPNQARKSDYLCRTCRAAYEKAWRERRRDLGLPTSGTPWKNRDKAKAAAWSRDYMQRPEVRKRKAELAKAYRRNPRLRERHAARWLLNRAVASGRIAKEPCSTCGCARSEAHHPDYMKPLDVVWLCRPCHRSIHSK